MSNLPRLKRRMQRLGITQWQVAQAAQVSAPMVNHVINGRAKSRKVLAVIERLVAQRGNGSNQAAV